MPIWLAVFIGFTIAGGPLVLTLIVLDIRDRWGT